MPASPALPQASVWNWLDHRPALLLIFTTLVWGSNVVAARLAVGHVSPMMLTTARWSVACIAQWLVARRQVVADWPLLRPRWHYLTAMGVAGFTGFNALYYNAAHHTSAANLAIIQGVVPVLVLLGAAVVFRLRVSVLQALGVLLTLAGVALVAARGQWSVLRALDLNVGDVGVLAASVLYAGYTLGLRAKPAVSPLGFLPPWRGWRRWPRCRCWPGRWRRATSSGPRRAAGGSFCTWACCPRSCRRSPTSARSS